MSSHRSAAVVVVAVLLANLFGDSVLTSASPQIAIEFGDSSASRTVELPRTCGIPYHDPDTFYYGLTNAPLGGHPWMVALGYRSTSSGGSSSEVSFKCNGVLVTTRHVITAANCVDPKGIRGSPLVQLNVGDWDIDTDPDCRSPGVCAPPVVVRRPSLITVHPEYNTNGRYNNDIAIVQLDQAVPLGPFIQPICIPESFDLSEHTVPVAVVWKRDEGKQSSTILQEVLLPFVDIQVCNASFNGLLSSGQVCAEGEPGRNSCAGDSGSPLVTIGEFGPGYILIGVSSFGKIHCGSRDSYGVYTSASYFRDWIVASLTV